MSPRARVVALVTAASAGAVAVTVGVTVATSSHAEKATAARPRAGVPPLALDLGVRIDPEARALRRAERLFGAHRREAAGRVFARYRSLEARVGLAFARWPDHSLAAVQALAAESPRSSLAQLHLGLALFWSGRDGAATAAWRRAARVAPDTASAVAADDLLHPGFPKGLPVFLPGFGPPPGLARLSPPAQLRALRRAARAGVPGKLLYGVALQRLGRPLSAERQYLAAAAAAPRDAGAQVAAAVGRFSKVRPSLAFSRLGPLVKRFPNAPTVRFHLGLLLLWIGQVDRARQELRRAAAEGPHTRIGREARTYLRSLRGVKGVG